MPRSKPLNYLPTAINFSEIPVDAEDGSIEDVLPGKEPDFSSLWIERSIMDMLGNLTTDRERAIMLLLIMRGDGYNFDQRSIASLFKIKFRWYMRVVQGLRRKLSAFDLR